MVTLKAKDTKDFDLATVVLLHGPYAAPRKARVRQQLQTQPERPHSPERTRRNPPKGAQNPQELS